MVRDTARTGSPGSFEYKTAVGCFSLREWDGDPVEEALREDIPLACLESDGGSILLYLV